MTNETLVYLVTEKSGDFFEIDVERFNFIVPDNGMFVSIQVLGYANKSIKKLSVEMAWLKSRQTLDHCYLLLTNLVIIEPLQEEPL